MAWIELTTNSNEKLLVNTDQIVRIEGQYSGGTIIHTVAARDRGGKQVTNFEVSEDLKAIESILARSQITVGR